MEAPYCFSNVKKISRPFDKCCVQHTRSNIRRHKRDSCGLNSHWTNDRLLEGSFRFRSFPFLTCVYADTGGGLHPSLWDWVDERNVRVEDGLMIVWKSLLNHGCTCRLLDMSRSNLYEIALCIVGAWFVALLTAWDVSRSCTLRLIAVKEF